MTTRDVTLGKTVLAYDQFLTDPDVSQYIAQMRDAYIAAGYTSFLDQADAAVRQVSNGLEAIAETGQEVIPLGPAEHPDWVRLGLISAFMGWILGRSSTCLHNPDPRYPQPIAAAAWKPGLVVCGRCAHLLAIPRNSVKDRTCDGCGRVTTGPENDDGIWPNTIVHGPLVYSLGTCRDCLYWDPEKGAPASWT